MKTIETILISKGQLDRIYRGELSLHLWRALRKDTPSENPLYPDFAAREIRPGRFRDPDVTVEVIDGVECVVAKLGEGTSLFDRPGVFSGDQWAYFEIPAGTRIPDGLIITKDSYNDRFGATHYSITPNFTMAKTKFCQLLNELACNAMAQRRAARNA